MNSNMHVANLTERLIRTLCPDASSSSGPSSSSRQTPASLLQLALRILSSDFAVLGRGDLFHVGRAVRRTLVNSTPGRDVAASGASTFETLVRRLESSKSMRHGWSAVYLLHALSRRRSGGAGRTPGGAAVGASVAAMSFPPAAMRGALFGTLDERFGGISSSSSSSGDAVPAASIARGSVAAQARQHTPNAAGRVRAEAGYSASGPRSERGTGRGNGHVSEQLLIRDIVFALQGIEGSYIGWDPAVGFAVRDDVSASIATRQLVRKLCESGWLYRRLTALIECFESSVHAGQTTRTQTTRSGVTLLPIPSAASTALALAPPATRTGGLVRQALCQGLRDELSEYYKIVAVLQAQVETYQHARAGAGAGEGGEHEHRNALSHLTLRRLLVWTAEPVERLRVLVSIAEASATAHGGALASAVAVFMHHGDYDVRSLVERLMRTLSQPLYRMMQQWLVDGAIVDRFGEFFVSKDATQSETVRPGALWQNKYALRLEMLPVFVPIAVARKILLVGKSIDFVRLCCGSKAHDELAELLRPLAVSATCFDFGRNGDPAELRTFVDAAAAIVNARLVHVLLTEHELMTHMRALKSYMLLGQVSNIYFSHKYSNDFTLLCD